MMTSDKSVTDRIFCAFCTDKLDDCTAEAMNPETRDEFRRNRQNAQKRFKESVPASIASALTSLFADSRVLIPGHLVGRFLGKNGDKLAAIASHLNVRAYMGFESLPGGDKYVVFESTDPGKGLRNVKKLAVLLYVG